MPGSRSLAWFLRSAGWIFRKLASFQVCALGNFALPFPPEPSGPQHFSVLLQYLSPRDGVRFTERSARENRGVPERSQHRELQLRTPCDKCLHRVTAALLSIQETRGCLAPLPRLILSGHSFRGTRSRLARLRLHSARDSRPPCLSSFLVPLVDVHIILSTTLSSCFPAPPSSVSSDETLRALSSHDHPLPY